MHGKICQFSGAFGPNYSLWLFTGVQVEVEVSKVLAWEILRCAVSFKEVGFGWTYNNGHNNFVPRYIKCQGITTIIFDIRLGSIFLWVIHDSYPHCIYNNKRRRTHSFNLMLHFLPKTESFNNSKTISCLIQIHRYS